MSTPEYDKMMQELLEIATKYQLPTSEDSDAIQALKEAYLSGVVYTIKTTNELSQKFEAE